VSPPSAPSGTAKQEAVLDNLALSMLKRNKDTSKGRRLEGDEGNSAKASEAGEAAEAAAAAEAGSTGEEVRGAQFDLNALSPSFFF
jgi:hypothetical protein